jgi:putative heme-binding domain-containing protein
LSNQVLCESALKVICFAETADKETLIMSHDGGIFRFVRNQTVEQANPFPRYLSETGLFRSTRDLSLAAGVYPYRIAVQAWQDGAECDYVLAIPGSETISTARQQRQWKYPAGSVFAKTLSREVIHQGQPANLRIETQLLHFDGIAWQPYSYRWNEEQTDAGLVSADGESRELNTVDQHGRSTVSQWRYHSRSECRACHSNQAGGAIGFTFSNLAVSDLQSVDRGQVEAFVDLQILDRSPPPEWSLSPMVAPSHPSASLEQKARSYLAANCAHCHCRGGGGTVALDLTFSNTLSEINAIDFPATQGTFGIADAKVIQSGAPYRSVLYYRMATSGMGHMPKLWSRDNDLAGLTLIHDWIAAIEPLKNTYDEEHTAVADALRLFHQLASNGPIEETVVMARKAFVEADAVTRGLFERFLPAEERVLRLGGNIDSREILNMPGDAQRGREQFLNSKTQQCRSCHRLENQGIAIGPDFDGLGKKRTREELLESILDPAKKIEPEFATFVVVTFDGEVLSGLRVEQTDSHVRLRTADGKEHRIAVDDIEHMTAQSTSLMPMGLAAEMTAQELSDLLAFLSRLK